MGYVRVRPASQGGPCAVRHPEHGEMVVPNPAQPYRDDDALVEAYPWLFVSDADLAGDEGEQVEQATKAPGEKRTTRRR